MSDSGIGLTGFVVTASHPPVTSIMDMQLHLTQGLTVDRILVNMDTNNVGFGDRHGMPRLSSTVVQELLDEINRVIVDYPTGVERTGESVSALIDGTSCFPGGTGLWRGDCHSGPLPLYFPQQPVMFVGHNFDSTSRGFFLQTSADQCASRPARHSVRRCLIPCDVHRTMTASAQQ